MHSALERKFFVSCNETCNLGVMSPNPNVLDVLGHRGAWLFEVRALLWLGAEGTKEHPAAHGRHTPMGRPWLASSWIWEIPGGGVSLWMKHTKKISVWTPILSPNIFQSLPPALSFWFSRKKFVIYCHQKFSEFTDYWLDSSIKISPATAVLDQTLTRV